MSSDKAERTTTIADAVQAFDGVWAQTMREQARWTDEQWDEHDARVAAERAAEEAELAQRLDRDAMAAFADQFPKRAIDVAMSTADGAAIKALRGWDPKAQCIVVLSGAPGTGKTVAATWWCWQLARRARFLRATTFAASSRYDAPKRAAWFGASTLVLDDLGAEYSDAKGNFSVDLDELVDEFYGDKRTLIITTNLNADDFRGRYGSRVTDRLRECGKWLSLSGASLRRKP